MQSPPPESTARARRTAALLPTASAWLLASLPAQSPDPTVAAIEAAEGITRLTTPDGSRFVLCPDPTVPLLHWAVVTWTDGSGDPAGFAGLTRTTLQVSLGGTWQNGSRDPTKEWEALAALDDAWQQRMQRPNDGTVAELLRRCDEAAQSLADLTTFPRILAALPVHRPQIVDRGPTSALLLTTLEAAVPALASVLIDRREDQALRDLPRAWMADLVQRLQQHASNEWAAVDAELLALVLPAHPFAQQVQKPAFVAPRRSDAMAAWERSQHPARTVHVLIGDFDPRAVRPALLAGFTTTALPAIPAERTPQPIPLSSARRAQVRGVGVPVAAIAWVLPPISDRIALATLGQWFAEGPDSVVGQALQRSNRKTASVRCRTPWPPTERGQALFRIEVADPAGVDKLAEMVVELLNNAAATPPDAEALRPAIAALQRARRERTHDARQLAATIGGDALLWPDQPLVRAWPSSVDTAQVVGVLRGIVAGQPVIVEGKP
jgi:hypothetical protein